VSGGWPDTRTFRGDVEMNIEMILPRYRGEMTGALAILADRVRAGEMSPKEFLAAQARIYGAYLAASVRWVGERMG
jgi:hypothetical protein